MSYWFHIPGLTKSPAQSGCSKSILFVESPLSVRHYTECQKYRHVYDVVSDLKKLMWAGSAVENFKMQMSL